MSTSPEAERPRLLRLLVPTLVVWALWLVGMFRGDLWHLFAEGWHMSLTMVFGSFIAGATSEGGGAVAFPVMTFLFKIAPPIARDFALMIQTVGMGAASILILSMGIRVERHALLWASLGGALGIVVGLEFVRLPPSFAKMLFVSTWMAFAFALYWINRYREREVLEEIHAFGRRHAGMLFTTGIVGGLVSSITGNGLDICTFAVLVLRLRICEKIATPTSVVLMAINAAVGFAYKEAFIPGGMAPEAWRYWWVCVPVVVVGAPFGAWFISERSRHFVARLLYVAIGLQLVWGILAERAYARPGLAAFSLGVFGLGALLFWHLSRRGVRRLEWLTKKRARGAGPPA